MPKPNPPAKTPAVREAERALEDARAKLRTAAAYYCAAVAGNNRLAGQLRRRLLANQNTDLNVLARRYPRLGKLAGLLASIGEQP